MGVLSILFILFFLTIREINCFLKFRDYCFVYSYLRHNSKVPNDAKRKRKREKKKRKKKALIVFRKVQFTQ